MSEKSINRTDSGRFKKAVITVYEHHSINKTFGKAPKVETPVRCDHDGKTDTVARLSSNLRLVTNECSNEGEETIKRKETTTTDEKLVWPEKVNQDQRTSIRRLSIDIDSKVIQQFLDEIEKKKNTIINPVAYYQALLTKQKNGEYVPSGAILGSLDREKETAGKKRLEENRLASIKNSEEFFARHTKTT